MIMALAACVGVGGGRVVTRAKNDMSVFMRGQGRVAFLPIPSRGGVAGEGAGTGVVATMRVRGVGAGAGGILGFSMGGFLAGFGWLVRLLVGGEVR